MMKRAELIQALQHLQVETGNLACLGCGHEHNCSTQGCAIIWEARRQLHLHSMSDWIRCTDALPADPCELVLVIANGWADEFTPLVNSQQLAVYSPSDGWMLEEYPGAEGIMVRCWAHIPQPPEWI